MKKVNILKISNKEEFRKWLLENSEKEKECYLVLKRGKPDYTKENIFYYLDAVYEALCFGWIDTTNTTIDGVRVQKFTPRQKKSNWTELNKERCRYLIKKGLMTDAGIKVLPPLDEPYKIDAEIEIMIKKAGIWNIFCVFPPLYQRVRAYNLDFYLHKLDAKTFETGFNNFVKNTKQNKMYGEWNDYGRLLDY